MASSMIFSPSAHRRSAKCLSSHSFSRTVSRYVEAVHEKRCFAHVLRNFFEALGGDMARVRTGSRDVLVVQLLNRERFRCIVEDYTLVEVVWEFFNPRHNGVHKTALWWFIKVGGEGALQGQ